MPTAASATRSERDLFADHPDRMPDARRATHDRVHVAAEATTVWLLPVLLTVAATLALGPWLPAWIGADLNREAVLIAALLPVLLLLLPAALVQRAPLAAVFGCALVGSSLALVALGLFAPPVDAGTRVLASLAIGLLVALFGVLCALAPAPSRPAVHALALLVLAAMALAPVWLAGLLDAAAAWPWLLDALVAVNPLTLLGSAFATDVPRADWFYRYSPLGSLRYDQPTPAELYTGYVTLLVLASAALALITRRRHPRWAGCAVLPGVSRWRPPARTIVPGMAAATTRFHDTED